MLFILAVALAVTVGLLRGGSLRGFSEVRFRQPWLVVGAFVIRLALSVAGAHGWTAVAPAAPPLHLLSYVLLLYALWCNRRLPGDWLLIAGTVLNAVVIGANGARMPVARGAVIAIGQGDQIPFLAGHNDYMHSLLTASARLPWLADRFVLPYLGATVFSLGDIGVVFGLFVLIQGVMVARPEQSPASSM